MGYTHYWIRNGSGYTEADLFTAYFVFADMARQIIETAERQGIQVADAYGERVGGWQIDNDAVRFNGYGKDAHETFTFERVCPKPQSWMTDTSYFDCCKTARKPYDTVVTAMLVAVSQAYGDTVQVSSDGSPSEWEDGLRLFEEATGNYATAPLRTVIV
jgi:hypothetical protein